MRMNKNVITINSLGERFAYEWVFVSDLELVGNKPCFIQLRNVKCRVKTEITEFINSGECFNIKTLNKFLLEYDMQVVLVASHSNFNLYQMISSKKMKMYENERENVNNDSRFNLDALLDNYANNGGSKGLMKEENTINKFPDLD